MGVIYTYFAAPTDGLAAGTINRSGAPGAADVSSGGSSAVEDAGFDPVVQCGTLEAILTGRTYEEVEASPGWGRLLAEEDGGERLVVALTDPLTAALAASTAEDRRTASARWAQTEEFDELADPQVLAHRLDEMSALARAARSTGTGCTAGSASRSRDSMADVVFVPRERWDTLPVQPPAGRWLLRMRPLLLAFLVCIGIGVVLGLVDATLHYPFPVWIAVVPLVLGIAVGVSALPLVVLAMRPYNAERRLGYTTWPDPKPVAAYRDSQH